MRKRDLSEDSNESKATFMELYSGVKRAFVSMIYIKFVPKNTYLNFKVQIMDECSLDPQRNSWHFQTLLLICSAKFILS